MTTYRDITAADLTHPATVLGGAMVKDWTGPASSHPDLDEDAKLFMDGLPLGHTGEVGLRRIERAHLTTLDFNRPEVRDRTRRVLAALGHRLGWFTDAEEAGTISPEVSAALWWANVARVDAGLAPLAGMPLPPWNGKPYAQYGDIRGYGRGHLVAVGKGSQFEHPKGWLAPGGARGPEVGDEGRACADAAALRAGCALLNPDHVLLPLGNDVVARLAVTR